MGNYVIVKEGNNYMVKVGGSIMYCSDSYAECLQYIAEVFMK